MFKSSIYDKIDSEYYHFSSDSLAGWSVHTEVCIVRDFYKDKFAGT